ncbi:MAG: polyhydroxyalkanoate granule-associated phasin [Rubrivivax sp.]
MSTRRTSRPTRRLATQSVELAIAAPQVVAQRLTRMALAGASPSAKDRREFSQMGQEKVLAFYQSWSAMWMQACQSPWQLAHSFGRAALSGSPARAAAAAGHAASAAATRILSAGLAPVHGKAVSNAKRLARTTRRR